MVADFLYSEEGSTKEERIMKYDKDYEEATQVFRIIKDDIRDFIWGTDSTKIRKDREYERVAQRMGLTLEPRTRDRMLKRHP